MLTQEACAEVAKPEWWNDEGLKALSARVVRAAPDDAGSQPDAGCRAVRAVCAWEAGPRSAAELREAAAHYERAAALHPAPVVKAELAGKAAWCRSRADAFGLGVNEKCMRGGIERRARLPRWNRNDLSSRERTLYTSPDSGKPA